MMNTDVLTYLDHNILDPMRKGDRIGFKKLLVDCHLTPVFSNETLKEIKRSVGSEDQFLLLLNDIGAKYIEPVIENNLPTGTAKIHTVDAFNTYEHLLKNDIPAPEYGYGLSGMLEKCYGGRKDETFAKIFSAGTGELAALIDAALKELECMNMIDDYTKDQINLMPSILEDMYEQISVNLDNQALTPVKQFETVTNLGAKVLKNISPPNILLKVYEQVKKSMPQVELDIDVFFGVKPQPFEASPDREKTLSEKANAIYHQLNFLGYYRDTGMKSTRGFIRSSSDMTHAGIATFCHFFFCSDEGLVKKAEAAYEYLGVGTKIVYFQTKKSRPKEIPNGG